jgi:CheY-like chemotaxis protein
MLQSLPVSETLPCPYCREPLRALSTGRAGLLTGFECDACGSFPDARLPQSRYSAAVEAASNRPGDNRRESPTPDRRMMPRGGRRGLDGNGQYPPVLIGDSDDGARRVFVLGLKRFGFQVLEAAAGEHALTLAQEAAPRVVITEATLPRDDRFQEYVQAQGIPCIVTVTNAEGVVPPHAAAVLEKPFSLKELLNEVFRVLRGGHTPAAN